MENLIGQAPERLWPYAVTLAGVVGLALVYFTVSRILVRPAQFLSFVRVALPVSLGLSLILLLTGLYMALVTSPADYVQGETVRIMYLHVPAAILASACYFLIALAGLGTLVWRHVLADVMAKSAAPIGAGFTLIALLTGAIWGKPTWGVWWVWDARVTSVLILFFLYLGLIILGRAIGDPVRAARMTAILALVGSVNLPIIKYSVEWWNVMHQPPSFLRADGFSVDSSMLWPMGVLGAAQLCIFLSLLLLAMRNEIWRRRWRSRVQRRAWRQAHAADSWDVETAG